MAASREIRLLGATRIIWPDGSIASALPEKCKALLCLRARRPGTRVARERIAGLLWPDSDHQRARTNLRQCLHKLRPHLGPEIICSTATDLRLEASQVDTDVGALENAVKSEDADLVLAASRLVDGDFGADIDVESEPLQEWLEAERAHIREVATTVALRAVAIHEAASEHQTALRVALSALKLDDLREDVHRAVMRAQLALGNRSAAIEHYRKLREHLRDELGADPDAETDSLLEVAVGVHAAVEPERQSTSEEGTAAFAEAPAIAIAQFEQLSPTPIQSHFVRGLAEELIVTLSGWRTFPVISAASSLDLSADGSGHVEDPIAFGRALQAKYVLHCTLRENRSKTRLTARLLNTESGENIWADRFDVGAEDLIAAQDDVAACVAGNVQERVSQAELARIVWKRTDQLSAWELVLLGQKELRRASRSGNSASRKFFRSALENYPDYVDAHVGMATSYCWDAKHVRRDERADALDLAESHAHAALDLDWNSAVAHARLGAVHTWREDLQRGLYECEIALQLNPSDAVTRMQYGNRLDLLGRTNEGIRHMTQGLRMSPFDPIAADYMGYLSRADLVRGDPEAALGWARRAQARRPVHVDTIYRLAACYAALGGQKDAERALQECERLQPGFLALKSDWRPYPDRDRNDRVLDGFRRLGLQ